MVAQLTPSIPWNLIASARDVILFGSHASQCASRSSDVDLLCVGYGKRIKSKSLDIIWITPDALRQRRWLGSELAGHIAAFGRCLRGNFEWSESVFVSGESIVRKRNQVQSRMRAFRHFESQLSEPRRNRYFARWRRDVQRLSCLLRGRFVPASAALDADWIDSTTTSESLLALMHYLGEDTLC